MQNLFRFERDKKIWDISYKGVPVWSYLRGSFYGQYLPYKPNFRFSIEDVKGFLTFFSLLWRSNDVIIFVSARKDLIEYSLLVANNQFSVKEPIVFTRSENGVRGNVFIIEVVRFLFRRFCFFFFLFSYYILIKKINSVGVKVNKRLVRDLIGDYYFNRFLMVFLRNSKAVLYSNAVVPRTERYNNFYNSIEVQHGVIHEEHLDYVNVPYISNKFICYSNTVKEELKGWGFSGDTIIVRKEKTTVSIKYDVIIFGTVDPIYSKFIEEICGRLILLGRNVKVKLHPRDSYLYSKQVLDNCVVNVSPLEARFPILPDTSLISDCFLNCKEFIYYSVNNKVKYDIYDYLINKYNIYDNREKIFKICYNVNDVLKVFEVGYES
ncbi:hypothetical protein ABTH99_09385 [Acinetobacter baumannii]|nr:hypothetical protein [Acinetobacter baumannii]